MNRKPGSRLLMFMFGLTVVCLLTVIPHHLMDSPMSLWVNCCFMPGKLVPDTVGLWLPVLARAGVIATLIVSSGALGRWLWQTRRFMARLNTAITDTSRPRLAALCTEMGLSSRVVVLATPAPLAFCYGLLNPRICLSTGLLDTLSDKELKAVLLHEDYHCRHYDPLRSLLADTLAAALFFLPAIAEWRDMFLTSVELKADRHAIFQVGRPALAGAMYKLLTHPRALQFLTGVSGMSSFSSTPARLAQLLDDAPAPCCCFSARSLMISSLALTLGCALLELSLF